VLSPDDPLVAVTALRPGDTIGALVLFTAFWFDGNTFNPGDDSGRGGGAICCEALLELEVMRGEGAMGRGEGGTEFRSGAMTSMMRRAWSA
jgi:hypothetical protein